jgi:hypothetical protein
LINPGLEIFPNSNLLLAFMHLIDAMKQFQPFYSSARSGLISYFFNPESDRRGVTQNSKLKTHNSQQFSPFSHAVGESITASQQPQPNSRIPGLQPRLYAAGEAGKPSEQPTGQSQQSKTQVTPQPAPNIPQGDKI